MSESVTDPFAIAIGCLIAMAAVIIGALVYQFGEIDRCKDVLRELRIANQPAAVTVLSANSCAGQK